MKEDIAALSKSKMTLIKSFDKERDSVRMPALHFCLPLCTACPQLLALHCLLVSTVCLPQLFACLNCLPVCLSQLSACLNCLPASTVCLSQLFAL